MGGKIKSSMCVDFTEASQFWIALLKCTPNMKKLWFREIRPAKNVKMLFREIRPRIGDDKKESKYGIIGKIFLIGIREIPATTHRIMIKIL